MTKTKYIPTQFQFDLLYSDYQNMDTPERFGQFIFNRTGFELENSYNETDTEKAWYMLRKAVINNQVFPATDWIACSERMPRLLPANADHCPKSKDVFFETYYGSIFHGSYIQREADADIETDEDIASENIAYEYFFNTHDGDELFEEDSITRWMYIPD